MAKKSAFFRLVRLVKWCLAIVTICIFAAISALYILISPEWLTERLVNFSEAQLGLQLKLSDSITIRHLPKIEAGLPAGIFLDPADGSPVGSFESARLKISPWGLLIGQLHISRAEISGLKSSIRIPCAEDIRQWGNSPIIKNKDLWVSPIVIRKFLLQNSDIDLIGDAASSTTLHVKQLETSELAPRMSPDILFSATLSDPTLDISADLDAAGHADLDIASQILGLKNFTFSSQGVLKGASFSSSISTEGFQYTRGVTTASSVNAKFDWDLISPLKLTASLSGLMTKNGTLAGKIDKVEAVQKLSGGTQSALITSGFVYETPAKKLSLPDLSLEYTVAADNLPSIEISLAGKAIAAFTNPACTLAAEGILNDAPMKISGTWQLAPEPIIRSDLSADCLDLSPKAAATGSLDIRNLFANALAPLSDMLGSTKLAARLSAKKLRDDSFEAADFKTDLLLQKGELSLHDIRAKLYGGVLEGGLQALRDGSWSSEFTVSGIRYEDLASAFEKHARTTGLLNAKASIHGASLFTPVTSQVLSGHVLFELADGSLEGLKKTPIPFEAITGRAELQNGIGSCSDFLLRSKDLKLSGTAEFDLRTLSMAGDVIAQTTGGRPIPVSLDGTIFRPEWMLSEPLDSSSESHLSVLPKQAGGSQVPEDSTPLAKALSPSSSRKQDLPWYDKLKIWVKKQLPRF